MPRVSVIIPVFNAAQSLPDTLRSLQAQTCDDWEAICIDDGSSDDSLQVVRGLASMDHRIRVTTQRRRGATVTCNRGALHFATGDLVAFIGANDLWPLDYLDRLIAAFDTGADAVIGPVTLLSERRRDTRPSAVERQFLSIPQLLAQDPVGVLSNLSVRREAFHLLGGFDATLTDYAGTEFLVHLAAEGLRIAHDPALQVYTQVPATELSRPAAAQSTGREAVLTIAALYGVHPDAATEAVHARQLARRALRLGMGGRVALHHVLRGVQHDARAFLSPADKGAATALAACLAPFLPRRLRLSLLAA